MAKKSAVDMKVDPNLAPKVLDTQELLDAPRGVRRIEFVQTAKADKVYFRAYTKSLNVPNLVSIGYPNIAIAKERWQAYVDTGKIDYYYIAPKKGKKS